MKKLLLHVLSPSEVELRIITSEEPKFEGFWEKIHELKFVFMSKEGRPVLNALEMPCNHSSLAWPGKEILGAGWLVIDTPNRRITLMSGSERYGEFPKDKWPEIKNFLESAMPQLPWFEGYSIVTPAD